MSQVIRCVALSPALDITYETEGPVRSGVVTRPTVVHRRAGGEGTNVARVISALGGRSVLAGLVSGPTGELFACAARGEGLTTDLVPARRGETPLSITVLGQPAPTQILEDGPAVGESAWRELVAREAEADASWSVVTGVVPPGLGARDLADLVAAAARQRLVALDARGPVVAEALAGRLPLSLLQANRTEASTILGLPEWTEPERLCAELSAFAGCPLVVVTCGADGAVARVGERLLRVAPGPLGPHPTGSGDAFLGALVLGLDRGIGLGAALRAATEAASVNAHAPTAGDVTMRQPGSSGAPATPEPLSPATR